MIRNSCVPKHKCCLMCEGNVKLYVYVKTMYFKPYT